MPATEVLDGVALVDDHCHGVTRHVEDRYAFESFINEGPEEPPERMSHFDAPIGLTIRRWCAPVLGLDPMASAEDYVEQRLKIGDEEATRTLLRAARLGSLLIDTGYRTDDSLDPTEMGAAAGAPAHEIVRIESVAEEVAAEAPNAADYSERFAERLAARAAEAVGFKSVVAYRGGFGIDPSVPAGAEVTRAAGEWLRKLDGGRGARPRLEHPVLLRHGIWTAAAIAVENKVPIQFHSGFGDTDLDIHLANPSLLTGLVRRLGTLPVNVVFLHCYPYHREAGYLAAVFKNVYFDLGSVLNYVGPSVRGIQAEGLEIAPFTKQVFSTDAFGLPELYLAGAQTFRAALGEVLDGWIGESRCTSADAERIAHLIGEENARRIYPID